jgi:hypothetical protein
MPARQHSRCPQGPADGPSPAAGCGPVPWSLTATPRGGRMIHDTARSGRAASSSAYSTASAAHVGTANFSHSFRRVPVSASTSRNLAVHVVERVTATELDQCPLRIHHGQSPPGQGSLGDPSAGSRSTGGRGSPVQPSWLMKWLVEVARHTVIEPSFTSNVPITGCSIVRSGVKKRRRARSPRRCRRPQRAEPRTRRDGPQR